MESSEEPRLEFIIHPKPYVDNLGRQMFERVCVAGELTPNYPRFMGMGKVNVMQGNQQTGEIPYEFPIHAKTVEGAYALFAELSKAESEKVIQKLREMEQRIVVAGGMPPPQEHLGRGRGK